MAQLIIVGQRYAVGIQQTVCAFVAKHLESASFGSIYFFLVAIKPAIRHFPFFRLERHSLVNPFPHTAAGNAWSPFDDLPLPVVVLERDAERMAILSEDDWPVGALIEGSNLTGCGIMRCIDIGNNGEIVIEATEIRAHLRIADGARSVEMLLDVSSQLLAHRCQRILIAQTPNEYRCMVLVTTDGCLGTLAENVVVGRVAEMLISITEGHLVDDIEAQRVSQLVETRLTGIVRCADIVHRGLFHQAHILERQRLADHLHMLWVGSMASDASQFDGTAIQLEHMAVDG